MCNREVMRSAVNPMGRRCGRAKHLLSWREAELAWLLTFQIPVLPTVHSLLTEQRHREEYGTISVTFLIVRAIKVYRCHFMYS